MKRRGNLFVRIAVGVLIIVCAITLINNRVTINNLTEQKNALEESANRLSEEIEEIRYNLTRELDDEYIMRIARDELNMHLPGEIVFYYIGNEK